MQKLQTNALDINAGYTCMLFYVQLCGLFHLEIVSWYFEMTLYCTFAVQEQFTDAVV